MISAGFAAQGRRTGIASLFVKIAVSPVIAPTRDMDESFFCYHGHFYQPPRGVLFEGVPQPQELDAAPFRNWNEKIAAECYTPNAALGNFALMSFDIGANLLQWLEAHLPETYQQIIQADRDQRTRYGVGNALPQSAYHTVLPLASDQDKTTVIKWGLARFQHRYGRPAVGMWLPEMAVDLSTLQALARNGIQFTLLSQTQVRDGGALQGAGPYWVELPEGARIAVYVRDDKLSLQLAYGVRDLGGAGLWSRDVLMPHRKLRHRLTLVATDGETFGHYHAGEENFLHWLLKFEAGAAGYRVTTLARDLLEYPPQEYVEVCEATAWSCAHGLSRWSEGCPCTPGDSSWKSKLRRAMDSLAVGLDGLYQEAARATGVDPWALRDDYVRVDLGQASPQALLAEHGLSGLDTTRAGSLFKLLRAQVHRQSMYGSSTFSYEDLDRPEPRYAIANALAAIQLTRQATGQDLEPDFGAKLALAVSGRSGRTGADLLDEARSGTG